MINRKTVIGVAILAFIASVVWFGTAPQESKPVAQKPEGLDGMPGAKPNEPNGNQDQRVKPQNDQPSRLSTSAHPMAKVRSSEFRNTGNAAKYVGMEACIACHEGAHESYLLTTHSRSLGETLDDALPEKQFDHPSSGRTYKVYRENGRLRHRETLTTDDGAIQLADHPVAYVVGSGRLSYTFLIKTAEGFLAESPVTWYAGRKDWALSPGFEDYNTGFARPVYAECLACHAGRVESVNGNRSRVSIHAMTIDCERCHGPGSLHVQRHESNAWSGDAPFDDTIVNPRHLDRRRGEAICAQCHLESAAEVDVRGRRLHEFRPGLSLDDFRVYFGLQAANRESMRVVGHVETLRQSRCYQSSQLTCATCHESHGEERTEEQKLSFYRQKCLDCHEQSCGLPEAERKKRSANDDCMSCHMPASKTEVLHVAATHHRIGLHQMEAEAALPPQTIGELAPLSDLSHLSKLDRDRCRGLAYLDVSLREGNKAASEAYRVRARDLLESVLKGGLKDPRVDAALAKIYQPEDARKSFEYAVAALQSPLVDLDTRTDALFAQSNSLMSARQTEMAIRPLEELTQLRRQAGDWFMLGVCKFNTRDIDGALAAAKQAVAIRPDMPRFRDLLAELHRAAGDEEEAKKQREIMERLKAASQ